MSIPQWALVSGIKGIIADAPKDGKIDGLVEATDNLLESFFPGDEREISIMLVEKCILPFCRKLIEHDPEAVKRLGL